MLALVLSPYHDRSFALGAVYTYVFGLLAAALIALARRGQRSPSRAVRDRVRFLVVVGAAATTFSLADFLSYLGRAPAADRRGAGHRVPLRARRVAHAPAPGRHLRAGRPAARRRPRSPSASPGSSTSSSMVIGGFDTMYLNAVLAAIVFLVLFEPLQTEVETRIHQFFFRERYDLETSVDRAARRLAHVLEIDEMVTTLMQGLETLAPRDDARPSTCATRTATASTSSGSFGADARPSASRRSRARPLLDRLEKHPSLSLEEMAREAQGGRRRRARGGGDARRAAELRRPRACAATTSRSWASSSSPTTACATRSRPRRSRCSRRSAAQIGVVVANSRVYSRMKERDRLAALGSMAAGLAHEVKNPLGAIKGAAQLLEELGRRRRRRPDDPPTAREFVGIILEEVEPARPRRRQLPRLRAPARRQPDPARPQRGRAAHGADPPEPDQPTAASTCSSSWASRSPRAQIDPEQFRQVLINLMQNAIQAMDGARARSPSRTAACGASAAGRVPPARARRALPASRRSLVRRGRSSSR